MASKEWVICEICSKKTKRPKIKKGKFLCYKCWRKEVILLRGKY